MNDIAGIPYAAAEFDKKGTLLSAAQTPAGTTDLFVISHGWNNDRAAAEALYHALFTSFQQVAETLPSPLLAGRKLAIVGVFWPSKQFDELVALESQGAVSGGAAGLGGAGPDPKAEKALRNRLDRMKLFFDEPAQTQLIEEAKALIAHLETSGSARAQFVETVRSLLSRREEQSKEDASDAFFRSEPSGLMDQLRIAEDDADDELIPEGGGGAALAAPVGPPAGEGGAAGISEFFSGFKTAAMNVLNYATYYEMKERAGTVGRKGVAPLLDELALTVPRMHLVGHSFGGRLVASAAANSSTDRIRSMTLLQAAFSHNGFSQSMSGFFRSVIDRGRVRGPILITYTKNDKAVGIAYPIASRLAGQIASALGDENDRFGGIGRNGAQKMNIGEVIMGKLGPVGSEYRFAPGKCFNAEATPFISGHSAVTGKEVAYAVAMASLGSA